MSTAFLFLTPVVALAMNVAGYNQCVQSAVQNGQYDTTHCNHFLHEDGPSSSSSTTQQSSSSSSDFIVNIQDDSSSSSAASSSSSGNQTSSESSGSNSSDLGTQDIDSSAASSIELVRVEAVYYATDSSPCPPRARGTTAEEKAINPNFVCKCLEGYMPDTSRRACLKDPKYNPDAIDVSSSSSSSESPFAEIDLSSVQLPDDVPADAWYANALRKFIAEGYIEPSVPFRPGDLAQRGEFIAMLVRGMMEEVSFDLPETPTFDDIPSLYHGAFELAAANGWIQGEGNCIGTHPCYIQPENPLTRAASAVLIQRSHDLVAAQVAPVFMDVHDDDWFADGIRTVGSRCILRGDGETGYVRPGANMNRAEMIVMLARTDEAKLFPYCL